MHIGEIDFPQPLLDAQRGGRLVIFAGAGVSIPSPSNYPTFATLAKQVASGVLDHNPEEPFEHFLGRLAHRGIDIHARVSTLLSSPDSAPNTLHFDLLRLFPSAVEVRVVTTNFDNHFSTASMTVFNQEIVETYYAPALPVGDSFTGLVYLHGSVDKPVKRLVLTDSDFGRAYLTEGWARRFLQQLFAKYVVLFIGYSYKDTVMQYLTRGLPPETGEPRRFALTQHGQTDHWKFLGINPLEYSLTDDVNRHAKLVTAVAKWSTIVRTGMLEEEEKIKNIVEKSVPLDTEDLDYIEAKLAEISTVRFFTRYTKRKDWLYWIETKEPFKRLFRMYTVPTEIDEELARWFSRTFVCNHHEFALGVLRRQHGILTPILWSCIAQSFHTEKPPSQVVQAFVPLLIRYPTPNFGGDFLEYTIFRSQFPEDSVSALLLFDYLTRPDIILREKFRIDENADDSGADVELTTEANDHWLPGVWENFFKPNLKTFAHQVVWIITAHIQEAYLLLESFGKVHENWDPISARRGMIESASQGSPEKSIGLLIDAARDIFLWSVENDALLAERLIGLWFSSTCRVMKRLAIFGVSKFAEWNAEKKIDWILSNDLIYAPGYKHEVFQVFENAYPDIPEELRSQVLKRAMNRPQLDSRWERTAAYEEFSLLNWLKERAPNSVVTDTRLKELIHENPDFVPRDHADMDTWIGPVEVGWKSPLKAEEMLVREPAQLLEYLLTFDQTDFFNGPSRQGLLFQVTKAVGTQFQWGMQLAVQLAQVKKWDSDLWNSIIGGWTGSVTSSRWFEILQFLLSHKELYSHNVYTISNLLAQGVETPDRAILDSDLGNVVSLAKELLVQLLTTEVSSKQEAKDWLFVAINNPAGTLGMFFLRVLSKLRQSSTEWKGIPDEYKEIFASIVTSKSYAAEIARIALTSQLLFLFGSDASWTIDNIIPLLDWDLDTHRAKQCWHGYLGWGQWNEGTLPYLIPLYEKIFPVLHSEFPQEQRHAFCLHLAAIATLSSIDPVKQGWLNRFLLSVNTEEREILASDVGQTLKGLTEASKIVIWDRWIQHYWKDRNEGIPLPLSSKEVRSMMGWVVRLEPVFAKAVDLFCEGPTPDLEHAHIYYELSNSEILKTQPTAVLKFLCHLLRIETKNFWACEYIQTILTATLSVAPDEKTAMLLVCDEIGRLGCGNAGALRKAVLASRPSST